MTFKKGDIVEVINEEHFYSRDYPVGTTWVVARDQESGYYQVYVYDSNQTDRGGEAILWDYNLKLVEQEEEAKKENEMRFKLGDTYICTETTVDYWTVGKEYPVQLRTGTNPCIVDDEGIGWYQDTYEMYATFKLNEEEKEMAFKIGDKVYGKNRHNEDWLTGEIVVTDKQWGYRIKVLNSDYKYAWLDADTVKLLLEEKPKLDLNNLTTAELREYVELVEDKEEAEFLLECFIEKVTK